MSALRQAVLGALVDYVDPCARPDAANEVLGTFSDWLEIRAHEAHANGADLLGPVRQLLDLAEEVGNERAGDGPT
jgi:hypothetical protein